MNNVFNISLLPGDGIGQEISAEALKILDWFSENTDLKINVKEELVGGISVDEYDSPLTNDTLKNISHSDAILLGACLLYTSPSPRDSCASRMPSSA